MQMRHILYMMPLGNKPNSIVWNENSERHFSLYLESNFLKLSQTNQSLLTLDKMKDPKARLTRWALSLQPYKYEIVHRVHTEVSIDYQD